MLPEDGYRQELKMFLKKRAFTLVELMVAIMLSAIIVFFSYTMTISAYKMFTKMHNTSYSIDNVKFFEEAFKKSVTESSDIQTDPAGTTHDVQEFIFTRYDTNIGEEVTDVYTLEDEHGNRVNFRFSGSATNRFEVYPENVTDETLKGFVAAKLFVETSYGSHRTRMLLLSNVKAVYFRFNKTGANNHLQNITIGIIYYDDSSNVVKRQNKSFCFTSRSISV